MATFTILTLLGWVRSILLVSGLGLLSLVWVEITRDLFHIAGHTFPPLIRFHWVHHRAFNKDLSVTSDDLYRKSHFFHDIPEAILMITSGIIFWLITLAF